jgi:hypothetical protein
LLREFGIIFGLWEVSTSGEKFTGRSTTRMGEPFVSTGFKVEEKRRTKQFLTEREAEKKTEQERGLLFGELLLDYVEQIRNERKAVHNTAQRLSKHVLPYFGNMPVSMINQAVISAYAEKRRSEVVPVITKKGEVVAKDKNGNPRYTSNGTINRELAAIKRAFALAMENGEIQYAPVIKTLKESAPRSGFFEWPELQKVLSYIQDGVVRAIILFTYWTGWRKGRFSTSSGRTWISILERSGFNLDKVRAEMQE